MKYVFPPFAMKTTAFLIFFLVERPMFQPCHVLVYFQKLVRDFF